MTAVLFFLQNQLLGQDMSSAPNFEEYLEKKKSEAVHTSIARRVSVSSQAESTSGAFFWRSLAYHFHSGILIVSLKTTRELKFAKERGGHSAGGFTRKGGHSREGPRAIAKMRRSKPRGVLRWI